MRWLAVLLLCASTSACDYVFVLDPDPAGACGPFGEPRPLAIDPALEQPQYFSARNVTPPMSPTYGAVYAQRAGVSRLWILEQGADELTWNLASGSRNSSLLDGTLGGSLGEVEFPVSPSPGVDRLLVWRGIPLRPFEARFIPQGYAIDNLPMIVDAEFDIMVGNTVEVLDVAPNGDMSPQRKRVVVTKVPLNGMTKPALVFADRIAPYNEEHVWIEDANRTMPINMDKKAMPGRGAITSDTRVLVYSVKYGNGTYDIYESEINETTRQWGVGFPVRGKVNTADDEVDPWINGDCSTLYFSRSGTIYRADRVDE